MPLKIFFLSFLLASSANPMAVAQDTALTGKEGWSLTDSIVAVPGGDYSAGKLRKKLLGENYRETWKTPVKMAVFNPEGFKIVGKGEGSAAKSLILEWKDGRHFMLWSTAKNPQQTIPEEFREVLSPGITNDLSTAVHPYASLIVSTLARAAGIFHTNPRLVYVQGGPWLGDYRDFFGDTPAFLEEKPESGEWNDYKSFGFPDDIHAYQTAVNNLIADHDYRIDERFVIRNRLFDLLIGDWDRHDGQWMWALFEEAGERIYRPIPLNRDQAFFAATGFLPKMAAQKWAVPQFQGFAEDVKWIDALMHAARHFDRFFITESSARDWLDEANRLQNALTDRVIEDAVRQWPKPVFELDGERVIEILKARRDRLHEYALDYCLALSDITNVRGSDKNERFVVRRISDRETEAAVYKAGPEGEAGDLIYKRIFITGQTREVRLYGLGGDDIFQVEGNVKKGLRVRIIGGKGKDYIADSSHVSRGGRKTIVYDEKKEENTLKRGPETKNRISNRADANLYTRNDYKTDKFYPIAMADYSSYDGIFLGAGAYIHTFGFRKEPFSTKQLFTAIFAPAIDAWNIDYLGEFNEVIGKTGLYIKVDLRLPYSTNFFGMGNESQNLSTGIRQVNRSYYRIRYKYIKTATLLKWNIGKHGKAMAGPSITAFELLRPPEENSYLNDLTGGEFAGEFSLSSRNYAGAQVEFSLDTRDNPLFPSKGVYGVVNSEFMRGLNQGMTDLGKLSAEVSFYARFGTKIPLAIGNRTGAEITMGDFNFLQAAKLGENTNLRGFRKDRFAGRSYVFNNTELRLTLFKRFIIPGSLGVLTFCDAGRVWMDEENSGSMHVGYGCGLWFAPLNKIVGSLSFGFSREESFQTNLSLGYSF